MAIDHKQILASSLAGRFTRRRMLRQGRPARDRWSRSREVV